MVVGVFSLRHMACPSLSLGNDISFSNGIKCTGKDFMSGNPGNERSLGVNGITCNPQGQQLQASDSLRRPSQLCYLN